jgi:formate dehydrogenase subunit delta
MHIERLVKMANDIGKFFSTEPTHTEAVDGIAQHLQRFWDPRMRKQIIDHLHAAGGEGLQDLVREAVLRLEGCQRP